MDDSERFIRRTSLQVGVCTMMFFQLGVGGALFLLGGGTAVAFWGVTALAAAAGAMNAVSVRLDWRRLEAQCPQDLVDGEPVLARAPASRGGLVWLGVGHLVLTSQRLVFLTGSVGLFNAPVCLRLSDLVVIRPAFLWSLLVPGVYLEEASGRRHSFAIDRAGNWAERIRGAQGGLGQAPAAPEASTSDPETGVGDEHSSG